MLLLLAFLPPVALYGVALVFSFRRWGWFGVAVLAAAIPLAEALVGTWAYLRPHVDAYPRSTHWKCHGMVMLPMVVMLTMAGAIAVGVSDRREGWGPQLSAVWAAFAVMLFPAIGTVLYWVVDVLGCDTL